MGIFSNHHVFFFTILFSYRMVIHICSPDSTLQDCVASRLELLGQVVHKIVF